MPAEKPYRRGAPLQWPLTAEQLSALSADVDDIYQRLRALRGGTAGATGATGPMGPPGWDGRQAAGEPRWPMFGPTAATTSAGLTSVSLLTNGDPLSPELVFDSFGDVIMVVS